MRELESVFVISTCGVSPFEVWQQKVWAILVNDCSFPHAKAYLTPRAPGSLAVRQRCWGTGKIQVCEHNRYSCFPGWWRLNLLQNQNVRSRKEHVKLLPQRLPPARRGEKSHKEGQKESSTPAKKRGRGKRLKDPESLTQPHVTGEGDQEEKYNLGPGRREEGKLAPDEQGIKKHNKKTQKWAQSHSAFTRDSTKGGMTQVSTHPH